MIWWVCDVDTELVDLLRLATWKVDLGSKKAGHPHWSLQLPGTPGRCPANSSCSVSCRSPTSFQSVDLPHYVLGTHTAHAQRQSHLLGRSVAARKSGQSFSVPKSDQIIFGQTPCSVTSFMKYAAMTLGLLFKSLLASRWYDAKTHQCIIQ